MSARSHAALKTVLKLVKGPPHWFFIFPEWCSHHHDLIRKHFPHSQRNLVPTSAASSRQPHIFVIPPFSVTVGVFCECIIYFKESLCQITKSCSWLLSLCSAPPRRQALPVWDRLRHRCLLSHISGRLEAGWTPGPVSSAA